MQAAQPDQKPDVVSQLRQYKSYKLEFDRHAISALPQAIERIGGDTYFINPLYSVIALPYAESLHYLTDFEKPVCGQSCPTHTSTQFRHRSLSAFH